MQYRDSASHALSLFDSYVGYSPEKRTQALAGLRQVDAEAHDVLARMLDADKASRTRSHALWDVRKWVGKRAADNPGYRERVGTSLGAWKIDRMIGVGGMGAVYEAHRRGEPRHPKVAIKCMHPWIASSATQDAFEREWKRLGKLKHPCIPGVLDRGVEQDGLHWFAMRYISGYPLDAWVRCRHAGIRRRVELVAQASAVLSYVHGRGVLHQDIKPSNFIVDEAGRVNLIDFGLASGIAGGASTTPRVAVSKGYVAPEVWMGRSATLASDVYSLGVVLYEFVGGALPTPSRTAWLDPPGGGVPWSGHGARLQDGELCEALMREAGGLGREGAMRSARKIVSVALRCIAVDPTDRYATMEELKDDLVEWLASW